MQQMNNRPVDSDNMLMNAMKGAIAGAIGVWVMDRIDWFMFDHEDPAARRRTQAVRPGGMDPAHVAASRIANKLDAELSPAQHHIAGQAIHYALGVGPAALYGAFRERLPVSSPGQDTLYGLGLGLGLFLIQDEGLNQAMGLSAKQKDYPWQAHARGLVAHLTLGLVANTILNLLNAPRPTPSTADDLFQYREEETALLPGIYESKPQDIRSALH